MCPIKSRSELVIESTNIHGVCIEFAQSISMQCCDHLSIGTSCQCAIKSIWIQQGWTDSTINKNSFLSCKQNWYVFCNKCFETSNVLSKYNEFHDAKTLFQTQQHAFGGECKYTHECCFLTHSRQAKQQHDPIAITCSTAAHRNDT